MQSVWCDAGHDAELFAAISGRKVKAGECDGTVYDAGIALDGRTYREISGPLAPENKAMARCRCECHGHA